MLRWFFIAVFAFTLTACASEPVVKSAKLWPELDSLFQHDPRWIGGDGAYSCDLGNNRILWLFGDSSIAKDATRNSDTGWFIRNSLAIQTGYDPKSAYMAFYWGDKDGHPSSFLPKVVRGGFGPVPAPASAKVLSSLANSFCRPAWASSALAPKVRPPISSQTLT